MRPPRKFTDSTRSEINPEWADWNQERRRVQDEMARETVLCTAESDSTYFPEDHDKDLGDGSWIFVVDPPNGSVDLDFEVPQLSMWFARPNLLNIGKIAGRQPYQAVIQTPAGDLHLWPHEYVICENPKMLLGQEGVEIHSLGGDPVLDEEQLFYLTSRGIPGDVATQMLFDQIKSQSYCYVTFPDWAVEFFSGVGTSLRSHVRRNPRTRTMEPT